MKDPDLTVGFQGDPGAYSERALARIFPKGVGVPFTTGRKVFEAVESGAVRFGVVPLENSRAGSINETYGLLVGQDGVHVVAETVIPISHCLLALPGVQMSEIKQVLSHPQALEQCSEFIESIGAERVVVNDTAGAARKISEDRALFAGAIASDEAAQLYGLAVLAYDIEDAPDNSTRFVAVAPSGVPALGPPTKTSIVFATTDAPGELYRCLQEFAERDLNLTKIESRPTRERAWHYHFYLDFDAPSEDPAARAALDSLSERTTFLKVLGSYPSV